MLPLTPFIGREKELAEVQSLLAQPTCHLLTLVGPGGIGKTRLALRLSMMNEARFAYGTAVVSLRPLHTAEFFMPAVANALGISLTGKEPPLEQITHYLRNKEIFIILDDFEHILDAADQFAALQLATPHVKYLITSRETLNLQEEWLYPLAGLPFPADIDNKTAVQSYEAVQLFSERAQRANPTYSVAKEAKATAHICQLVGGMPLALELAAVWRRSLSCEEIAAEIQRDLDFLTARLRDVPERHRSIQAVFNQTWQRLTRPEQDVFKRLSMFRGGFQREAAVDVSGASLSILSALVDKSLLWVDGNDRYHIHELLRQYAAEQLERNTEDVQKTQADHAAYYINYLYHRKEDSWIYRQREAITEVENELDNIRSAWQWAVEHVDTAAFQKAGDALMPYYQFKGNYLEGLNLYSQAVGVLQAQERHRDVDLALISTLSHQSWFNLRMGKLAETEKGMRQCQEIYRRLNIPPLAGILSDPAIAFSVLALIRGDYETAILHAEQVRQTAASHQHSLNHLYAHHLLCEAYLGQGEAEMAHQFAQQAYAAAQTIGDQWFTAYILNNLGQIAAIQGDYATAKTHFQASYGIRQSFADPEGMARAANKLGHVALMEQALPDAETQFRHSHTLYEDINDKGGLAEANRGLGRVALAQGDFEEAQNQFREALQLGLEINFRSLLLSLLVNIAELLWQLGQRERPLTLLTFTVHHPAIDYETKNSAHHLLEIYQLATAPALFAAVTQPNKTDDLKSLCTALLYDLTLPYTPPKQTETDPMTATLGQPLLDPLTPRELEVLHLVAAGHSNPEIAAKLILSVGTVKAYTNKIFSKLGVHNRVKAVTRARELKLL